ncbi:MAG: phosphoadenosine phosphosulfate reductase family protein [Cephaloticoccus sp.]|nr:phosphoadenosine phosphosulfate reductase family protein [Cephaloticoccus sp.]MCF7759643.1 phosphoadenosine phosphosulfate reductase family protein [Cephaloticoccus sp.]
MPLNSPEQIAAWNSELREKTPLEIVQWAVALAPDQAIVSTNFRPYEAVVLHLATRALPEIPVLWVDHGYNRPATYRHAETLRTQLNLNLHPFLPRLTVAHRDAIHGPVPDTTNETALKLFSTQMKLEPFQRGMSELAPKIWITALRKVQNPNRAELDIVSVDKNFGALKISPVFHWSDADLEAYLAEHDLPNEWDYFDPAKADEKRECGLHAAWGKQAVDTVAHGAGI